MTGNIAVFRQRGQNDEEQRQQCFTLASQNFAEYGSQQSSGRISTTRPSMNIPHCQRLSNECASNSPEARAESLDIQLTVKNYRVMYSPHMFTRHSRTNLTTCLLHQARDRSQRCETKPLDLGMLHPRRKVSLVTSTSLGSLTSEKRVQGLLPQGYP
ncbi:hypothetical protein DOTSEDRAFT_88455 [Dothistroma septosporum NZE10]|uniref:Uncharacterized protein n=1 Tax=Dothistroma septosporum (strain NZE10 / CBS 128990) TaxID=675120 RepID=N1PMT2_DOTSN|nr:hypothetical protein DOTSEDRAFT_88455 [Dothistroma septosporum NZE10]